MAVSTIENKDVKIIEVKGNVTCAAQSNAQGTFAIDVPAGYSVVGAVGYSLATQMWTCFGFWTAGNSATINVRNNNTSGSQTLATSIFVLLKKI